MENCITIIKVKQKRTKYEVYTNIDEEPILFTEEEIVINRIIKGATFEKEKWEEIKNSHEESIIYEKILKYLTFKPRTIFETTNKLKELTNEQKIINKILDKLINLGFLNDSRYTKSYIESSIRLYKGPILITFELSKKGIAESLIKEQLIIYTTFMQIDIAYELSIKQLKLLYKYPKRKKIELLTQKLLRNGFSYSIINQVIPMLDFNQEEDNFKLKQDYEKIKSMTTDKNKIIQKLLTKGYEYSTIKKIINKVDEDIE